MIILGYPCRLSGRDTNNMLTAEEVSKSRQEILLSMHTGAGSKGSTCRLGRQDILHLGCRGEHCVGKTTGKTAGQKCIIDRQYRQAWLTGRVVGRTGRIPGSGYICIKEKKGKQAATEGKEEKGALEGHVMSTL